MFEAHGVQHPVSPGKGFLVNVQDAAYQYYYPKNAREPWCFVYLQMAGDATHMMVGEMVRRFGYVYDLRPDHPLLEEWADMLLGKSPGVLTPHHASRVVTGLLEALLESASLGQESAPGIPLIRSAMELLSQHPRTPWNASTLAAELRVSREHLGRLFKTHTGRSAYDYIRDYRIRTAAQELRQNTLSIKEVSDLYGFTSPATFSKAFKQVFGVSPRDWLAGAR
jgi:AraC-like DNA-binding protein